MQLLVYFLIAFAFVCESVIQEIQIGGAFAPVDNSNVVSLAQVEHLAAFKMAINDLNNKTDNLWDDVLPNIKLKFAIESGSGYVNAALALPKLTLSFNGTGVVALVGALSNTETTALNMMTVDLGLPLIHSASTDTLVDLGKVRKVKIIPQVPFQGQVFQSILCHYVSVRKIVVISSQSSAQAAMLEELLSEEYCTFTVLDNIVINPRSSDLSAELTRIRDTGGRYFAFLLEDYLIAKVLEQGYNAGLFRQNTLYFSASTTAASILQYFTPAADVATIMTGYFSVVYWPTYVYTRRKQAIDFAKRWAAQEYTGGRYGAGGQWVCNNATDDNGLYYLHRSQENPNLCTGLNFSSYPDDGSTIQSDTILTYDAVILLAKALDYVVSNGGDPYDNLAVYNALLYNVSFEGVSGLVDIYEGRSVTDPLLKGERIVGINYLNYEFSPTLYRAGEPIPFAIVGAWRSDGDHFFICGVEIECNELVVNSPDGNLPSDSPPDIILNRTATGAGLLYAVGAFVLLQVLFLGVFTYTFEKTKQIKASQPIMLYCILAGGVLAGARVIVDASDRSEGICQSEIWLGHLAFVFVFGSLFVKTYRVNALVNSKTLKKVVFTSKQAFQMFAALVAAMCVYLVLVTMLGDAGLSYSETTTSNQTTKTPSCGSNLQTTEAVLYICEFVFLLAGFRLCYAIKDVPDSINESRAIAKATASIVATCCVLFPLTFLLHLDPLSSSLMDSLAFGFGATVALGILFVPKVRVIYKEYIAKKQAEGGAAGAMSPKIGGFTTPKPGGPVTPKAADTASTGASSSVNPCPSIVVASDVAMTGMNVHQRFLFSKQQQLAWQTLTMQYMEADLDSDHKNSADSYVQPDSQPEQPIAAEPVPTLPTMAQLSKKFFSAKVAAEAPQPPPPALGEDNAVSAWTSGQISGGDRVYEMEAQLPNP